MTESFFRTQLKRLADVFGEKNYPVQRVEQLWNIVKEESERPFEKFIDKCLTDYKFAPIGPEFREFVNEREDARAMARKSVDFSLREDPRKNSIFTPEEISQHFKVMISADTGKITKDEAKMYADCLRSAIAENKARGRGQDECEVCSGYGLYMDNQQTTWSCHACEAGKKFPSIRPKVG